MQVGNAGQWGNFQASLFSVTPGYALMTFLLWVSGWYQLGIRLKQDLWGADLEVEDRASSLVSTLGVGVGRWGGQEEPHSYRGQSSTLNLKERGVG